MACVIKTASKRHVSGKSTAKLALTALILLGTFAATAGAQGRRDEGRRDDHRADHRNWNGGYYLAPPVVYGEPYYAPPPVIYGPAVGIVLPGIAIGIQ
jgi:hypothetical protein